MGEISPGKVQNLSPRAALLYPMRLDEVWALLFPASSPPAHWPPCQFVYLRSKVCSPLLSASPRGYALRFATVTIISSGWLLSSNKILPMLGTLGQTIVFRRLPRSGGPPKQTTKNDGLLHFTPMRLCNTADTSTFRPEAWNPRVRCTPSRYWPESG